MNVTMDLDALGSRYLRGVSVAVLARELGCAESTLYRHFSENGIQRTIRKHPGRPQSSKPITYGGYHRRVTVIRGKPRRCEECGTRDPDARYEWANISGDYADPDDYKRLCHRCHVAFDGVGTKSANTRRAALECRMGHPREGNVRIISTNGRRQCRLCCIARSRAFRRRRRERSRL